MAEIEEAGKQITADSILKDAYGQRKNLSASTKADILDLEELKDWQRRKRTEYESVLRRNRLDLRQWMRYAQFELDQKDIKRARSVYERALLVDHGFIPLWIQYIDAEIKWKNINHARNLLDRATNALPRVDKLWYKYLFLEEALGNVGIVRGIYTRWCSLEPGANAWDSFIDFEIRQSNLENVRNVYTKYVLVHPGLTTWLKWIKFEQTYANVTTVRTVFSLALDTLTSFAGASLTEIQDLVNEFAQWEASQNEYERARALYALSIEKWPASEFLKEQQILFEKKFGSTGTFGDIILEKRKAQYEQLLDRDPFDYSTWWVYIDLCEERYSNKVISAYDTFVDKARPTSAEKGTNWKRYIRLCIRYAVYLELKQHDDEAVRRLFHRVLQEIPHKHFTFSKVWIHFAEFELRRKELPKARKILGTSLGKCPKPKTFKYYIDMELKLKEFDRVRKLYEKYLDYNPNVVQVWLDYAELEENLGDEDRARALYQLSLSDAVDLSAEDRLIIIQRFIAFETDATEYQRARALYEDYLKMSSYDVQVWINRALFESTIPTEEQLIAYQQSHADTEDSEDDDEFTFDITDKNKEQTRSVFEKAIAYYKSIDSPYARRRVLQALLEYEKVHGTEETVSKINDRLPTAVKRKDVVDGIEEESLVLKFPDDADTVSNMGSNLLALARKWQQSSKDG